MHRLDGTALAERLRTELQRTTADLSYTPTLAVMIVGEDPASHLYVRMKKEVGEELGFSIQVFPFPAETGADVLKAKIHSWNADASIDGILVQVPLPNRLDESEIIQTIDPVKDVDGFHPANVEALFQGELTVISPLHEGILRLINEAPLKINGAQTTIIANSEIFSKPLTKLLKTAGANVRMMFPDSLDKEWLKESKIVIIAIGRRGFLTSDLVQEDAVIIDVGTNRDAEGHVQGDVPLEAFIETDCWVTPVPGGVGPMTIALLMTNIYRCAERRRNPPTTSSPLKGLSEEPSDA